MRLTLKTVVAMPEKAVDTLETISYNDVLKMKDYASLILKAKNRT